MTAGGTGHPLPGQRVLRTRIQLVLTPCYGCFSQLQKHSDCFQKLVVLKDYLVMDARSDKSIITLRLV